MSANFLWAGSVLVTLFGWVVGLVYGLPLLGHGFRWPPTVAAVLISGSGLVMTSVFGRAVSPSKGRRWFTVVTWLLAGLFTLGAVTTEVYGGRPVLRVSEEAKTARQVNELLGLLDTVSEGNVFYRMDRAELRANRASFEEHLTEVINNTTGFVTDRPVSSDPVLQGLLVDTETVLVEAAAVGELYHGWLTTGDAELGTAARARWVMLTDGMYVVELSLLRFRDSNNLW